MARHCWRRCRRCWWPPRRSASTSPRPIRSTRCNCRIPPTWTAQVWNIAGYYACLLPFFFLAGVFVSLSFVLNADRIGQVYGYDLTGAGAGAALVLAAMFVVHAFFLVPLLLVPLAASACFVAGRRRWAGTARGRCRAARRRGTAAARQPGGVQRLQGDLRAAAHARCTRGRHRAVTTRRLRAAGRLHRTCRHRHLQQCRHARRGRPAADLRPVSRRQPHCRAAEAGRARCRLCRRIAGRTAVSADPACRTCCWPAPRVASVSREILALGAAHLRVLEPEPVLLRALERGLGPSPAWASDGRVSVSGEGPVAAVRDSGSLRHHRPVGGFPRRRGGQRDGIHRAGASRPTCGRWRLAGSCPSRCRSATSRSMRCACWRPPAPR